MTKEEARELGKERGYNIASLVDLPEIGQMVKEASYSRSDVVMQNVDDCHDTFTETAYECESNSRQYSDFSFLAKEINDADDEFGTLFDAFDEGISDGIEKNWQERKDSYED